ncbi:hypothetical protein EVAR_3957_1 [Eumeta japonica]|uniref:Uncharacterized protein n=1 Tax=Eumeta variegata TaxID=151549 RepID=A0A4C1STH3_EUMVA|nr:hypothetical protein EVAR_3957_1 [Eumeta japonica]
MTEYLDRGATFPLYAKQIKQLRYEIRKKRRGKAAKNCFIPSGVAIGGLDGGVHCAPKLRVDSDNVTIVVLVEKLTEEDSTVIVVKDTAADDAVVGHIKDVDVCMSQMTVEGPLTLSLFENVNGPSSNELVNDLSVSAELAGIVWKEMLAKVNGVKDIDLYRFPHDRISAYLSSLTDIHQSFHAGTSV